MPKTPDMAIRRPKDRPRAKARAKACERTVSILGCSWPNLVYGRPVGEAAIPYPSGIETIIGYDALARFARHRTGGAYGRRVTQEPLSVSRAEAARLTGYSIRTIDRMCARGELRKGREGGRAVIERASIEAYISRLYDRPRERPTPAQLRSAWLPELAERQRRRGAAA